MADKATGERGLGGALVILASLAMVLVVAAPALAQEGVPVTGLLTKPEITSYQYGTHAITDEATGASYALESGSVDLDAYLGQRITIYGTPVPGYQNGEIEGGPDLLSVTRVDEPTPKEPSEPAPVGSTEDPLEDPYAPPDAAGEVALLAAESARQASEVAQAAEQSVQQAADTGDPLSTSQAAEEAQEASEVARVAAEEAEQAAEQAGSAGARQAAQEARQAAEEAQEASGAAQTVAEAAQQAAQKATRSDVRDAYSRALEAARSGGGDNVAFAAEDDPEETKADSGKAAGDEATREDTGGAKKAAGKDVTTEEAEFEEDTGGVGSNASAVTPPERGSVPLLLGGGVLLVAGIVVARKMIR